MPVAVLRLFAQAREAAGVGRAEVEGATVAEVVAAAVERFGPGFAAVAATSRIWLNGQPAADGEPVASGDEVAVLPPVSGGCAATWAGAPDPTGHGVTSDRWCERPTDPLGAAPLASAP